MKCCIILLAVVAVVPLVQAVTEKVTDKVTFEVSIGNENIGKIEIGLFGLKAPKTVENFLVFASEGFEGKKYEGSIFHRVIKGFMIQGGDVLNGDGTGSISIYGSTFADELPSLKHSVVGLLSMANSGPNTNGSQFFITTALTPWLNNKHVVFGKLFDESMEVLKKIEETKVHQDSNRPVQTVKITKSVVKRLPEKEQILVEVGAQ